MYSINHQDEQNLQEIIYKLRVCTVAEGKNVYLGARSHGFDSIGANNIFLKIFQGDVRFLDKPTLNTQPA